MESFLEEMKRRARITEAESIRTPELSTQRDVAQSSAEDKSIRLKQPKPTSPLTSNGVETIKPKRLHHYPQEKESSGLEVQSDVRMLARGNVPFDQQMQAETPTEKPLIQDTKIRPDVPQISTKITKKRINIQSSKDRKLAEG